MKYLDPLKYFLRIEVDHTKQGIYLCPHKYALSILSNTEFLGARPLIFLMEQNHQLGKAKGPLLSNPESNRHLMGCLIYLTFTRLDLAYSVQVLSQFMHQPRQEY